MKEVINKMKGSCRALNNFDIDTEMFYEEISGFILELEAALEKQKDGMQPSGNHLPDEWVAYEMGKKPRPKESK
jgi:hypothetical protein